ncbi:hypothetical protein I4U23_015777 [Adineta vaga]|nr:hypothetical protein I4U23_015777 [Adineta vaga]
MGQMQGSLEVTVIEGRNLKDKDVVGKNDAYVEVYLDKDYKQRTTIVKDTNDPTWNQRFTFKLDKETDYLYLNVYDDDVTGRDSVGSAKIDLKKHVYGKPIYNTWVPLPRLLGLRSNGEIHVIIEHRP